MRGDTNIKGTDSSEPSVYFRFCVVVIYKQYKVIMYWKI